MSLLNLEVGQGIKYCKSDRNNKLSYHYGLIINTTDNSIGFLNVLPSFRKIGFGEEYKVPCYKDGNALYEKHRNNVRLEGYLSVFTELSNGRKDGVYVYADIEHPVIYDAEDCKIHKVAGIDGNEKISKEAMAEVLNHPWIDQPQKEKLHRRPLPDVPENIRSPQDDMQLE